MRFWPTQATVLSSPIIDLAFRVLLSHAPRARGFCGWLRAMPSSFLTLSHSLSSTHQPAPASTAPAMAAMTSASVFLAAPAVAPRRAAKGLAASSSLAMRGETSAAYFDAAARTGAASSSRQQRLNVVAGNNAEGGIFSPLVVVTKKFWPGGDKEFNKFRGKAISLHSQVWPGAVDQAAPGTGVQMAYLAERSLPSRDAPQLTSALDFPQVITEFCKTIGADAKVRQGLIRVAKANGGKLVRSCPQQRPLLSSPREQAGDLARGSSREKPRCPRVVAGTGSSRTGRPVHHVQPTDRSPLVRLVQGFLA